MYNGWGSIYWDSSVGDTAAWGLHLQQVGVADQPLVDEFTTNYIVGGENLCLAPSFDNYTSEMGAISGITSPSQGSAVFNGTSDYIETPELNQTLGSVAFWMYRSSATNSSTPYKVPIDVNGGVSEYGIMLGSWTGSFANEVISFGAQIPSAWRIAWDTSDSNAIPAGWNHVAITQTGATYSIYLNGSLKPITISGTPVSVTIGSIILGARKDIGGFLGYYDGNLANVAIWNRALTSDEINSVMWKQYQDLNTQEINGLQAWYSLDSTEVFDWYNYAQNQGATIEGKQCVDNALNALAQL